MGRGAPEPIAAAPGRWPSQEWVSFWTRLRRGPWPEVTLRRLIAALEEVIASLRAETKLGALLVVGPYARGDFSRRSAVDLLAMYGDDPGRAGDPGRRIGAVARAASSRARLPMALNPIVARVGEDVLTPERMHELWRDGVVLYGETAVLALLRPSTLAPWVIVRYSMRGASHTEGARLSYRLRGSGRLRFGALVRPPAVTLGRGVFLLPALHERSLRQALEEAGASFEIFPVWREA